jgi:hypothetical protein
VREALIMSSITAISQRNSGASDSVGCLCGQPHSYRFAPEGNQRGDLALGRLAIIDDPVGLDTMILKSKCVSVHWEFMFTRSLFQTPDMVE